jgi:hypothetical protein
MYFLQEDVIEHPLVPGGFTHIPTSFDDFFDQERPVFSLIALSEEFFQVP